jgi:hypothetical protein
VPSPSSFCRVSATVALVASGYICRGEQVRLTAVWARVDARVIRGCGSQRTVTSRVGKVGASEFPILIVFVFVVVVVTVIRIVDRAASYSVLYAEVFEVFDGIVTFGYNPAAFAEGTEGFLCVE